MDKYFYQFPDFDVRDGYTTYEIFSCKVCGSLTTIDKKESHVDWHEKMKAAN
jgi:hypothetical protein